MTDDLVLDGFAGPGGWSEGLRLLGLRDVGLEWDTAACRTRAAAGHLTIQTDIAQYPTAPLKGRARRQAWSPPCQTYSQSGNKAGLADMQLAHQAIHDLAHGQDTRAKLRAACKDERSLLVAEPIRFLHATRPDWVVMEQVPSVLALWRHYAEILRGWGYSVWTGILNAADYGVPQSRERAVLIASRIRGVNPPEPTHGSDRHGHDLFGGYTHPWVHMADVLDLPDDTRVITRGERKTPGGNDFGIDRPSWALTGRARSWMLHTNRNQAVDGSRQTVDPYTRPAPSFTTKAGGQWKLRHDSGYERLLTVSEGAVLQTFPADYPWQGTKTKQFEQIGNAVPPLLAAHIVSAATGIPMPDTVVPAAA